MTATPALTRNQLAAMIDHTLLAPEATLKDIDALCAEAGKLGVYAVCVSPTLTARAVLGWPAAPSWWRRWPASRPGRTPPG